jgi:hypothetical protein
LGDGFGNNLSGGAEAHDRDCDRSFCRQTAKAAGLRLERLRPREADRTNVTRFTRVTGFS